MNIIKNINLFKSMAIVAIVTMLLPSLILCSKSSQRERIFPSRNINCKSNLLYVLTDKDNGFYL